MTRLDDYQSALLAAQSSVTDPELLRVLDEGGAQFVSFIIDHGVGPLWHARTGRDEFHASRLSAEALYLAQELALKEIDTVLDGAGIDYVLFKGAANRLLTYKNPAVRACHDLDLLVRPEDKVRAATTLTGVDFVAHPEPRSISRELVLSRGAVDVDLHWGLLREGRLRGDPTPEMLDRRRRAGDVSMLCAEDALFTHLVHPAFAKHLAGWDMGLHRVVDIVEWLRTQSFDWRVVRGRLEQRGVRTAAWATLRWVELLTHPHKLPQIDEMMFDLHPGRVRRAWLDIWLRSDLSARTSDRHLTRLLGFTALLHDTPGDSVRALVGRRLARRREAADLDAFGDLLG